MEQAKKKNDHYGVTPDLELSEDQGVSDSYQSDGEGSDLSTRAEEIAEQVLADEQGKIVYTVLCHDVCRYCYRHLGTSLKWSNCQGCPHCMARVVFNIFLCNSWNCAAD